MANQAKQPSNLEKFNNKQVFAWLYYFSVSRYLFYLGKKKATNFQYTAAKDSFLKAARKAPISALSFRVQCNKWAIIVQLLLGEIPDTAVFTQQGMEKDLRPYLGLANAVRIADIVLFKMVVQKFASTFSIDGTSSLIVSLQYKVLKVALRNISLAYPRIPNANGSSRVRFISRNPVADAGSRGFKAIRDRVIDGMASRQSEITPA